MMTAITAPLGGSFAAVLNQAAKGLTKTNGTTDFVRIDNTLPKVQNNFDSEVTKTVIDSSQARVDTQQSRRAAAVELNHHQHQQGMIDLYLTVASKELQKQADTVSYSDLIALADSVKLNRLVSSVADFESVQSSRNILQEKYEHIIRPQPESVMRVQA